MARGDIRGQSSASRRSALACQNPPFIYNSSSKISDHSGVPSGRRAQCPPWVDTVEKVENSAAPKISRRLVFVVSAAASVCRTGTRTYGRFCVNRCCCLAIQRRYEGPWSILDESIWSLTSPRVRRISGSKKFRSSPQKDFFNTIGAFRTCRGGLTMSALGGILLQKSFCITDCKFSGRYVWRSNDHLRDHIMRQ